MPLFQHLRRRFNPHTHEGCDCLRCLRCALNDVSIHTPTKGVTEDLEKDVRKDEVSIHTPTKGVTIAELRKDAEEVEFQSTHPRRV